MHSHHDEAKFMADIKDAAPDMVSAFFGFDKAVFSTDTGNLDLATRELIAVGVAVTTQCPSASRTTPSAPSRQVPPRPMSPKPSWSPPRSGQAAESPTDGRR